MIRKPFPLILLAVLLLILPVKVSADTVISGLEALATHHSSDRAIETIFARLDITTKEKEARFLKQIAAVAKKHNMDPKQLTEKVLTRLDKRRFAEVDRLLQSVYRRYGRGLKVVVRTGSSGYRFLELAGKRHGHAGYRLLFSDDDISFVGEEAVGAAKYFNTLLEKKGLDKLKVKGFDIVHLKNIRRIDLHMLNLLESEKFVGEAAMAGIKKEMLVKGAVIAEQRGGSLVGHAEPLSTFIKNRVDHILANELDERTVRQAVRKFGAMSMIGSCERQITGAHGGWNKLSDPEKVKYVLRQRIALDESGALKHLAKMDSGKITRQLERLKRLKAKGTLTKGELKWLERLRGKNIMLAFEEIPYKLNPILAKARVSGRSLAANPEVRKAIDELTLGFVLMRDHALEMPDKQILAKLREAAGGNKDIYKIMYTSFQQGKDLAHALDAWLRAGGSREEFVRMLQEVEGHLARLELIKARRKALKKGSAEAKSLKEMEALAASKEGDRFLVKMLKNPAAKKLLIGTLAVAGGGYLLRKMYNSWMAGHLGDDLSDAAMTLVEFIPGTSSFKLLYAKGMNPRVVFSFVKEALYFTPYWPLVLAGDVVSTGIDIHGALRVQHNNNGLIDILVYAGEYDENGRFVRLSLPKKAANIRRIVPRDKLETFFFHSKTVVVPVSGQSATYRISNLSKVSNEILDTTFLANDAIIQQLRDAAQQQLRNISHHESWAKVEKGNYFSGIFEYAKFMTGYTTICEKSPEKWCKVFNLLKRKVDERRTFVKTNIMIPYIIQQAEIKHKKWALGNKPPIKELVAIQEKIERLRNSTPLGIELTEEVGKRADKEMVTARKNSETVEKQLLVRGRYWEDALKAYQKIYDDNEKLVNSITSKLKYTKEKIQRDILRFPWTGNYQADLKKAEASRQAFYHVAWQGWKDVRKIKDATPAPSENGVDRKALTILSDVNFRWRLALDRAGHPEKDLKTHAAYRKEYKGALQKVRDLYGKVADFQSLVDKEAKIVHGALHLGEQVSFAVKITGKTLQNTQAKKQLLVTWHAKHGSFGSNGRGLQVNFVSRHLLPVTVIAEIRDRFDPDRKGTLSVVVPVTIPKRLFHLTLKPAQPKPKEFIRAEVDMPDRYLNAYKFHYKWWGKGCRVEAKDRFFVVVTAPKTGKASVRVDVSAENEIGEKIALGSDTVSFRVNASKKEKAEKEPPDKPEKKETKKVKSKERPIRPPVGTGTEPEGNVIAGGGEAKKPHKRKVKHGAGGSASGMYPAETFNGMQISYSVSGASMPKMKDEPGFACSRYYEGRLGSGTLKVAGTARVTWSPYIVLSVTVSAGDKYARKTYKFKGPGSRSFSLSVPIPDNAESGGFSINMSGSYGNGEHRGVVVSGSFTADGPEGKTPKGTEDLAVSLSGPESPVQIGKKITITAKIKGGRFPYKYAWAGAKGTGEKGAFQATTPGDHTVTLTVTDVDGNKASGSTKITVRAPEFEITGLPSRPLYAGTARLRVRVKGGGKGKFKPIWQASEPGIEFDPPEGMTTTVTFGRVKDIAVWVQAPQPNGGKTLESKQVHARVVGPKFTLVLTPSNPYVGQEVRTRIRSSAKVPPDMIRWVWSSPPSSNRMEYNDPASEIGFKVKTPDPFSLRAEARVPHYGDVIGTVQGRIRAKPYKVKVVVLGPMGPKPRIWKEGKGLVIVERRIAVHQNVRLKATPIPSPKNTPLRYTWALNDDSHFAGLASGREVTVNRSQTGTCVAEVTIRDKDNTILGKGKGTFTVSISQQDLTNAKQKAADWKRSKELLQKGKRLWKAGNLDGAIAALSEAHELAKKNREITQALKVMQRDKERIDTELQKANSAIENKKLAEAKRALDRAGAVSKAYPPYKETEARLREAQKKAEQEKKRLAEAKALQRKANALWKKKEADTALDTMEKAAELAPDDKDIRQAIARWEEARTRGKKLESEGALLETADDLKGAVGKYRESLKAWPNPTLAKHVSQLEKAIARREKDKKTGTKVAKVDGKTGTKKGKLTIEDVFGGKKKGETKPGSGKGKPLDIDDIVGDGGQKGKGKETPLDVSGILGEGKKGKSPSGPGSKPLTIEDVLPGSTPSRPGKQSKGKTRQAQTEKKRDALIAEGTAAEKAGRFEEAIDKYARAEKIRHDAKVAARIRALKKRIQAFDHWIQRGYGYEKRNQTAKAIAAYKKALSVRYDKKVAAHIRDLERKPAKASPPYGGKNGIVTQSPTLKLGVWVLTSIKGQVGEIKNAKSSYYRGYISGREGRVVMTSSIKHNGHVIFKSVATWNRPPKTLRPQAKIPFTLTITKLVDPREYSQNNSLSMDTHDMKCGSTGGGGKIGSVGVYSVHSPKNPTMRKTFYWTVPEGRKGKKLTLRVCYTNGYSYKGPRGWKYYYTWIPAGSPLPKGVTGNTKGNNRPANSPPKKSTTAKTSASSKYTRNSKGDVFKKGHWAGARGGSDWLQKDFSKPYPISKIYIKRASTDVTTRGFRLVMKLRKPDGSWVVVDELRNTNINRVNLSGGKKGHSIPPYTKRISPPILATAFRLEFTGHGWFDATDIRLYTRASKKGKKSASASKTRFHNSLKLLTDGVFAKEGERWQSDKCVWWNGTKPRIVLDLGKVKTIVGLKISVDNNDDYRIAYSKGGKTYYILTTVRRAYGEVGWGMDTFSTYPGDPEYVKALAFSPVKARYLRIRALSGDGMYAVSEIQVKTRSASGSAAPAVRTGRQPWTGTYSYTYRDAKGTMSVTLRLTQNGRHLSGTIRVRGVSSKDKDLNFDFKKAVTGICDGNRGILKMEGQPADKAVLSANGRKLAFYDAEDNKKYILTRIR